jgi:hypothetical protein
VNVLWAYGRGAAGMWREEEMKRGRRKKNKIKS